MRLRHNKRLSQVSISSHGGTSYVTYQSSSGKIIDIQRTVVASEHEGQGIGALLIGYVLEFAQDKGYKVITNCPYARVFFRFYPEYQRMQK
ncbi:MAG: GNAT family N-acetyltransferase [Bacteroidota bacterium]